MSDTPFRQCQCPPTAAEPWTAREIQQQPATLRATQTLLASSARRIESFFAPLLGRPDLRIVLSGAGNLGLYWRVPCGEIARTDRALRRSRSDHRHRQRAGSLPHAQHANAAGVVRALGQQPGKHCRRRAGRRQDRRRPPPDHHLQCRWRAGAAGWRRRLVLVLPEATHDRGFAMTSSFSCDDACGACDLLRH